MGLIFREARIMTTSFIPLAVEIEETPSWPPEFLRDALKNHGLILSYQNERQRIDRLCQDDIRIRIDPPTNRYKADYEALLGRLDEDLIRHRIVGYHCTRLTPREIVNIEANGLRVLSSELVDRRLDLCVADAHLRQEHRAYLERSQILRESLGNRHGNRTGMIWFCPNRSTLQGASGVYRLFRSWGGEAIYLGHEDDEEIGAVLARVGTPCIVKCAIPFPCDAPYYPKFAARFFSQLIADEVEYPDPPADFDLRTKVDVRASDVLEIIEFSDPRFEHLTRCSTWPQRYSLSPAI